MTRLPLAIVVAALGIGCARPVPAPAAVPSPLQSIADLRRAVRDSNAVVILDFVETSPDSLALLPASEVVSVVWVEPGHCYPGGRCRVVVVHRCRRDGRAKGQSLGTWPESCTSRVPPAAPKPTPEFAGHAPANERCLPPRIRLPY